MRLGAATDCLIAGLLVIAHAYCACVAMCSPLSVCEAQTLLLRVGSPLFVCEAQTLLLKGGTAVSGWGFGCFVGKHNADVCCLLGTNGSCEADALHVLANCG
jgi:hypothetical protein